MQLVMSIGSQIKREFNVSPTMTVKSDVIPNKKPTFFSIDQILGKRECELSDDDDVFEKDDIDSYDGDKCESNLNIDDEDVDMSDDQDENNNDITNKDTKDEKDGKTDKQTPSYTAIIAQAILSSSDKKLPLGCIYEYIADHFPEFLKKGQGWRNCVRHNLSLSECFVKAGRARNGRGNYWGIHPRYIKNFSKGDFRKRRASHRPRNRDLTLGYGIGRYYSQYFNPFLVTHGYGKSTLLSAHRPGFSVDNILSKQQTRNVTPPPVLSSYKPWNREPIHSLDERSKFHLCSPPALSSVVSTSPSYLEHYSYRSYDYGRGVSDCSCHRHSCTSRT